MAVSPESSSYLTLVEQAQTALLELNDYVNGTLRPALVQPHLKGQLTHAQFFLIDLASSPSSSARASWEKAEHDVESGLEQLSYVMSHGYYANRAKLVEARLKAMQTLFKEQGDFARSSKRVFDAVAPGYLVTKLDRESQDRWDPIERKTSSKWLARDFIEDTVSHLDLFSNALNGLREEMNTYASGIKKLDDETPDEFVEPKVSSLIEKISAAKQDLQKPKEDQLISILEEGEDKITACIKPLNALLARAIERGLVEKTGYGR